MRKTEAEANQESELWRHSNKRKLYQKEKVKYLGRGVKNHPPPRFDAIPLQCLKRDWETGAGNKGVETRVRTQGRLLNFLKG